MKSNEPLFFSVNIIYVLLILTGAAERALAQWTNPVIDTITSTQIRKETMPQSLCIDDGGMLHLVWKQQITGGWRIFYGTNSPAGSWGIPQEVADSLQPAFDPAIAWWSAAGIPFVVYEQDSEIYAALLSGSNWQSEPVTSNGQSDRSPTIAIDGGLPHVAWITEDSSTGQYKIAYAMGYLVGPNISWSVQTLMGSDLGPYGSGASPFIAVSTPGIAHIVYRGGDYGNYHIHHAWNNAPGDTNWNYEILYSGNANDFSAALVIAQNGDCHLAGGGNDGWGFPGRVYYFHKPYGQPWQQYELASGSYSAVEPSLIIDADDSPHIVWMETSGNFYTGNIHYSGRDSAGTWQTVYVIGADHFVPSFQIDQDGYGHVACHTGGNTSIYDIFHVQSSEVLTAIEELKNPFETSGTTCMLYIYPNPSRTQAEIVYSNTFPAYVVLKVFSDAGAEIATLVDEFRPPGIHNIIWQPQHLSAGVYFVRLSIGGLERTSKCIVLP